MALYRMSNAERLRVFEFLKRNRANLLAAKPDWADVCKQIEQTCNIQHIRPQLARQIGLLAGVVYKTHHTSSSVNKRNELVDELVKQVTKLLEAMGEPIPDIFKN